MIAHARGHPTKTNNSIVMATAFETTYGDSLPVINFFFQQEYQNSCALAAMTFSVAIVTLTATLVRRHSDGIPAAETLISHGIGMILSLLCIPRFTALLYHVHGVSLGTTINISGFATAVFCEIFRHLRIGRRPLCWTLVTTFMTGCFTVHMAACVIAYGLQLTSLDVMIFLSAPSLFGASVSIVLFYIGWGINTLHTMLTANDRKKKACSSTVDDHEYGVCECERECKAQ